MNSNSINKFEKYKRAIILLLFMVAMVGLGGCETIAGAIVITVVIMSMLPVIFFGAILMMITGLICKKIGITGGNSLFISMIVGIIPILLAVLNFKQYQALIGKFF